MKILEHNVETGEAVERDATAAEIKQMEADAKKDAIAQKALADKELAKAALLDRLGITADEAKLLLS
jgi:hypothetical protein